MTRPSGRNDDVMLDRLLADAELSPDEVRAIEARVVPSGSVSSARALRSAFAPAAFALAAAALFVVVRAPSDEFSARGTSELAWECVAALSTAAGTCPRGASLVVRARGPVVLRDAHDVLRPLAVDGDVASAKLDVPAGRYEIVALPGGTLAELAAAVDAADARLVRAGVVVVEPAP